jgi:hypothetical protein
MAMSWNYRILSHGKRKKWYGLHEVYYNDHEPDMCTTEPLVVANDVEELIDVINTMADDAYKWRNDILKFEDFDLDAEDHENGDE